MCVVHLAIVFLMLQADVALSLCQVDHNSPDMDPTSLIPFMKYGRPSTYVEYGAQQTTRTKRSPKPPTSLPKIKLNSLKSNQVNVACRGDMKNLAELSKQLRSAKKTVNLLMLNTDVIKRGAIPAKYFKKYRISPNALLIRSHRQKPLKIDDNAFVGFGEQLTDLTIVGREVQSLSGIKRLKKLRSLILTLNYGKIQKGDFAQLKNLRRLEFRNGVLESTPIRAAAFELLKKLEFLGIHHYFRQNDMNINEPLLKAINKVPSLIELSMYSGEQLFDVYWKPGALKNLVNLEKLRIRGMYQLKSGMFEGLKSLTDLTLAYNDIETIEPGALNDLHKLRTLDLARNKLKKLTNNVLSAAPELKELYLNHNQLTTISPSLLASAPNLEILDLSHNPWNCDQKMRQVVDWIRKKQEYDTRSSPLIFELENIDGMLCNDGRPVMVKKCSYFYAFSRESEWAKGRIEPLK